MVPLQESPLLVQPGLPYRDPLCGEQIDPVLFCSRGRTAVTTEGAGV